ncbi:hypothetical protein DDD_0852 [Nonlabens dokdonensis DSW-6]|uniref:Uncharacterized protein n=2 Tax=Nonlabens dokdonensis TaxID=328515 RepID=L7W772_NONDD|nr:hypothetical protein DDD_0852 [Nonlabens dokdonensis DSW-6]
MLSIEKCQIILEDNSDRCYSKEEVIQIREFLEKMSRLVNEEASRQKRE